MLFPLYVNTVEERFTLAILYILLFEDEWPQAVHFLVIEPSALVVAGVTYCLYECASLLIVSVFVAPQVVHVYVLTPVAVQVGCFVTKDV